MDIEGSVSKLLNPVEKHGALIGAGLSALYIYKAASWAETLDRLMNAEVHFPDIQEFVSVSMNQKALISAVAVAVGGYLLQDATSNATLKKIAGIAYKGGAGYAAVLAGFNFLYCMTHSNGPSGNTGNTGPLGSRGYS